MAAREQYVVDAHGNKSAVIISLKRYQEMMEDLHDPAVVAERRNERAVSLETMKHRLKKDGILKGHPQNRRLRRICDRSRSRWSCAFSDR